MRTFRRGDCFSWTHTTWLTTSSTRWWTSFLSSKIDYEILFQHTINLNSVWKREQTLIQEQIVTVKKEKEELKALLPTSELPEAGSPLRFLFIPGTFFGNKNMIVAPWKNEKVKDWINISAQGLEFCHVLSILDENDRSLNNWKVERNLNKKWQSFNLAPNRTWFVLPEVRLAMVGYIRIIPGIGPHPTGAWFHLLFGGVFSTCQDTKLKELHELEQESQDVICRGGSSESVWSCREH